MPACGERMRDRRVAVAARPARSRGSQYTASHAELGGEAGNRRARATRGGRSARRRARASAASSSRTDSADELDATVLRRGQRVEDLAVEDERAVDDARARRARGAARRDRSRAGRGGTRPARGRGAGPSRGGQYAPAPWSRPRHGRSGSRLVLSCAREAQLGRLELVRPQERSLAVARLEGDVAPAGRSADPHQAELPPAVQRPGHEVRVLALGRRRVRTGGCEVSGLDVNSYSG